MKDRDYDKDLQRTSGGAHNRRQMAEDLRRLPVPKRWPDCVRLLDEMHSRAEIHTILWFRLWGGEGLPGMR